MINSGFLPAFKHNEDRKNIEPYVILNNVGYVGWTTMEVFANNKHAGHKTTNWFNQAWVDDGCTLSNTLNILRRPNDDRHMVQGYAETTNIDPNNLIIKEFMANVAKCINDLASNNPQGKLYLNVAAHEARWGILPVLGLGLNIPRKQYGQVFQRLVINEVFQRLVINVITGHNHNEKITRKKGPPYFLPNCGLSMNNEYWWHGPLIPLPNYCKFHPIPIINILTPGARGANGLKMDFNYNNISQDGFQIIPTINKN
jgi:hypothetical protein